MLVRDDGADVVGAGGGDLRVQVVAQVRQQGGRRRAAALLLLLLRRRLRLQKGGHVAAD